MCELQEMHCDPLCRRMELKDLLPLEMQRLTKYPLLIDSLLKHTPGLYCCYKAFCPVELDGLKEVSLSLNVTIDCFS